MSADRNPTHRTDLFGRAFAGSQLQIQIYVNRRPHELSQAIQQVIELTPLSTDIVWASPLERDQFAEYKDGAFLRALNLQHLRPMLAQFWPKGGPRWDALGSIHSRSNIPHQTIVLIEAKSNPEEIYGRGCQATPVSLPLIKRSLRQTQQWLDVSIAYDWTGRLYQYANRLAHLYFFREIAGLEVWLVNACFLNDPHSPTFPDAWARGLQKIKHEMGIFNPIPYTVDVFLPAHQREELFTA